MNRDEKIGLLFDMRGAIEQTFFRSFEKQYELPKGLNFSHAITMIFIKFHPHAAMSEISHRLHLERGSFTTVADKLIRNDYVISERGTKDRRVYHLNLTEKGETFVKDFKEEHDSFILSILDTLDGETKDKFFDAVEFISNTINGL